MEIYFILREYEIIDLITTDKELWQKRLEEIAKPDGKLCAGDMAEVWKDNKKLYDVYKLQDIR